MRKRRRRERGALLAIVLILLAVMLAASTFAYFGLRSDTGASANDRMSRQLFDCSEQALAIGKQFFGDPGNKSSWSQYFNANNICNMTVYPTLPCTSAGGPFPTGGTGTAPPAYPLGIPFKGSMSMNGASAPALDLDYQIGVLNGPGDPCQPLGTGLPAGTACAQGNNVIVYAVCMERTTRQSRSVQAMINVPDCNGQDYAGQAGGSFTQQGNRNHGRCR